MSRIDLIQKALDNAESLNIKIIPSSAKFDWNILTSWPRESYVGELPTACNWEGAVLIKLGYMRNNHVPLIKVLEYLDIGWYWMYRFHMGFNLGRQLSRRVEKDGKEVWIDDDESKLGIKMAKRYL